MHDTNFRFSPGQRVKLRDGIDPGFYDGMAKVGNEGWIAGRRRDSRFGLPEVFIRWDTDHWAYNRQPDCWTFQEHFDPVEEEAMTDEQRDDDPRADDIRKAAHDFANQLSAIFAGGQTGNKSEPPPDSDVPDEHVDFLKSLIEDDEHDEATFRQLVDKAHDALGDAEAFLTVIVTRKNNDKAPHGMLTAGAIGDSLTPEAEVLVGSQLSAIAARFHQESALMNIQQITSEKKDHGQ